MRSTLVLTAVLAASLFGQTGGIISPVPVPPILPGQNFPAAIRLYLDLTDAQVEIIQQANFDYVRFSSSKYQRMSQVQQEIAVETAKETLDPMALGVRYLELEAIRRQLVQEQGNTRTKVQQSLTDVQRTKLKALQDALNLYPIYSEAASLNLITPPASIPYPGNIIPVTRVGDFSPLPVTPAP